jgi:hypothetical protein
MLIGKATCSYHAYLENQTTFIDDAWAQAETIAQALLIQGQTGYVCLLFCRPCEVMLSRVNRYHISTLAVVKLSVLHVMKKPAGIFIVQINLINQCCPLQFKRKHGGNGNEENYM